MSDCIYLVVGGIDEPGHEIAWEVAAYLDRDKAMRHAERADARAAEMRKTLAWNGSLDLSARLVGCDLDPCMKVRQNWPTDYHVVTVPLRSEAL